VPGPDSASMDSSFLQLLICLCILIFLKFLFLLLFIGFPSLVTFSVITVAAAYYYYYYYYYSMQSGSLVTTAWRVLRLRIEETASRYGEYEV
jgi:hypothetical protein